LLPAVHREDAQLKAVGSEPQRFWQRSPAAIPRDGSNMAWIRPQVIQPVLSCRRSRPRSSFTSIEDAKATIEAWRVDHNQRRPHSSLGHLTPNEFVAKSGNADDR